MLGAGDLAATDVETVDSALQFTVSGVTGGQFELVSNAGVAITTFTQAQLAAGDVQFVHNGNEAAPTYSVSVFDGALTTGPLAATITFTNVDDAPIITQNTLTISEGETVVLGAGDLAATDVETVDSALQFTVSGVTGGPVRTRLERGRRDHDPSRRRSSRRGMSSSSTTGTKRLRPTVSRSSTGHSRPARSPPRSASRTSTMRRSSPPTP